MPFFRDQRQYQQLAFVAVIAAVTAVENTTLSSQVFFKGQFQYQSHTEPAFVPPKPITVDTWFKALNEPVRVKIDPRLAVALAQNANIDIVQPNPVALTTYTSPVFFQTPFQYPAYFYTQVVPETVTEDKWHYPWSEPVRQKIGLRAHLQQAFIAPVLDDETQIIQDFESRWHFPWSEPVRFRQYPTSEQPFFTIDSKTPEFTTSDKWAYPWSEPVRFRQFPASEQQAAAAPVFVPSPPVQQTSIAQFISANVQYELRIQYQSQARPVFTPTVETVTLDKWFKPFDDPVREKIGLKASLQQALIAPLLADDQITGTIESRWHQAWSEPVRFRLFPTSEQRALIQGPPQTVELITADKWIYAWSEPVRQKIGLKAHLQQAYIAPVLDNETQIIQDFESRWHQPWSEPVRVKRPLLTAQQQALIYQSAFFEVINIDKWSFAWSEPVREKIGLKTHLQQAFIGLTLNPETQIIQNYESRWHFAWSEPIRIKPQVPAGEQQFSAAPASSVFETITVDKWVYAWSEPVRQKIGLKAHLQQALIATTLNPETQIIQTYESRWHQAWSEPVRQKVGSGAHLQQTVAVPVTPASVFVPTFSTPIIFQDTFQYPTHVLTPIVPVFEGSWHQPWSEPTRRKASVASQPTFTWSTFTPTVVTVTVDEWIYRWSEPIRLGAIQYPTTVVWSTFTPPVTVDEWIYRWSEPVRLKPGLGVHLGQQVSAPPLIPRSPTFVPTFSSPVIFQEVFQYPTTSAPPAYPILVRTINWFAPLNEPVRLKIGLGSYLQRTFTAGTDPIENPFSFTLSATEINSDSAFFGITVYSTVPVVTGVPTVVVSIKEIQAIRDADVSIEEDQAIDNASVSIEET